MKKRHLYQSKHPFDAYAFEAFFWGSWQTVELLRIKDGIMAMHLLDDRCLIEERRPFSNLRVRSRQANLVDCTCFLRPGIDICVLSTSLHAESPDDKNPEPVWVDAKISSIERKPHESKCSCQFYIKLYVNQGPLGSEKQTLAKETEVVGLDQISILQKLERNPIEDQHYRWNFSEDCSSLQKTKVFLGKFSSDLSWLIVASVLKQIAFDVRSLQNKIVYQILGGGDDDDSDSLNSDNHLNAINFKIDDGITTSILFKFIPADTIEACSTCDVHEDGQLPFSDVMDLRRSKRRNVQPDRFLGCDILPETDNNWTRTGAYKTDKWKEEEEEEEEDMFLPLSRLFSKNENFSGEHTTEEEIRDFLEYKGKPPREVNTSVANQSEDQTQLAIVPVPDATDPIALEQFHLPDNSRRNYSQEINEICSKYYASKRNHAVPRKKFSEFEDMDFESRWAGKASTVKVRSKRYRSISSKGEDYCEAMTYRRTTLSAGAYNKLINSYMKNIDSEMTKEETSIVDQWNEFKAAKCSEQSKEMEVDESSVEDEGESSENEMLWKEMELSMASAYILEESKGSNTRGSTETAQKLRQDCLHEYILKEEIGILCHLCGVVSTEIRYVSAPFMPNRIWTADNKMCDEEDSEHKPDEDEGLDLVCSQPSYETPLSEENDNVWSLIPDLRTKLHVHQKKAFEFLWHNIAGSLEPALMEEASKNTGGCAISHSPGAGKTFLIIAFLVSYLKLFPGKRPLVLAPKTTLYTWYKEFIKWEIPIPVHLIHGRRTYRVFRQNSVRFQGGPKPSQDVMHVIDCLEKIQKWHAQPSVLVMGYTSFLTLIREDSKFAHRRHMAKVLRESPGLLILDEGHNPRSTKSRLRKALMKVNSDLRVLLSGTLFQNNFCEYFNTLCLARPKFIHEVLMELDPKFKKKKNGAQKARNLLESRARKLFIDKIAKKIDANEGEERMQGLNMLRNITNGFIDVYEAGNSDGLPGLQIYTLLMNPTDIQHEVLMKLHKIMATYHGYPLELELLITLASIHPSLVKTSNCVNKFFSSEELRVLENFKYDFKKGSKVMFVLNLVYRVIKKEKVLIFCHNIAPINLFLELFESVFRWQKGREILVLTGELELFERGRIMDKFEDPSGASRILLASITACAEGISLTAASRVILLDSEWNPSKTKQAIARAFRPGQQKIVYVYQLLATGTLEEGKYGRTTWKEWVSSMIFSEAFVEDPSRWQAKKIEDDILREMVEEDKVKSFHMIMKNEKASTG